MKPVFAWVGLFPHSVWKRSEQLAHKHMHCTWVYFSHICAYPFLMLQSKTTTLSTAVGVWHEVSMSVWAVGKRLMETAIYTLHIWEHTLSVKKDNTRWYPQMPPWELRVCAATCMLRFPQMPVSLLRRARDPLFSLFGSASWKMNLKYS